MIRLDIPSHDVSKRRCDNPVVANMRIRCMRQSRPHVQSYTQLHTYVDARTHERANAKTHPYAEQDTSIIPKKIHAVLKSYNKKIKKGSQWSTPKMILNSQNKKYLDPTNGHGWSNERSEHSTFQLKVKIMMTMFTGARRHMTATYGIPARCCPVAIFFHKRVITFQANGAVGPRAPRH